jgi:peptidoglycan hydrolase-like protein with peptidoglycan-binding domain
VRSLRASAIAQLRHPRTLAGAGFAAVCAVIAINALFLQTRPHPTPFFSTRITTRSEPQRPDDLVRAVQDALKQVGYYSGPLDGIMGPRTHAAITVFEGKTGREETGEASWELLTAIQNTDRFDLAPARLPEALPAPEPASASASPQVLGAPQAAPEADPLVAVIQKALARAAYGPVEADGFIGPQTRDAIMRFQRDHNLPATGEVSDALVIELRAAGALDDG